MTVFKKHTPMDKKKMHWEVGKHKTPHILCSIYCYGISRCINCC